MRQQKLKVRCVKRKVSKCNDVVRTYDKVQEAYVDRLEAEEAVVSF